MINHVNKLKFTLYYIVTSPIVVARNFYDNYFHQGEHRTEIKSYWSNFFLMTRNPKSYMKSLEELNYAKLVYALSGHIINIMTR